MILRWVCRKCEKKWIYPVDECIYCHGRIDKEVARKFKVVGTTKVFLPCDSHPIIPYNILILEDGHKNRVIKKVMKDYQIGDDFEMKPIAKESAVSIVKIKYDLFEAIKEALYLIGDIEVSSKTKILIKPDIMAAAAPHLAVTTNPKTLGGLIDCLIEKGASKDNIKIAEQVQYGDVEKALEKSEIGQICKDKGIAFVDLSKTKFIPKTSGNFNFEVSEEIYKHDLIINVPVLKTHLVLGMSGALENMTRLVSERNFKELQQQDVAAAIAHLHKVLPKYITVGDGLIGMQGNGPLNYGTPAFFNFILASRDPVAHDKVFQEIGLLPKSAHVETAAKLGIGTADLREIPIAGEELAAVQREIKKPTGSRLMKV